MDGFDIGSGLDSGFASGRDAAGRFVAGRSGNPAGKRPGTRNRKTILAEALRDGEGQAMARAVIDKALAGDAVMARFCIGLLSPRPRGRAIVLDLAEDARGGGIVAAFDATLAAMAAGEITPDEALTVTRVLDGRRRALQALALERRLEAEAEEDAEAAAETMEPEAEAASDPGGAGGAVDDHRDTLDGCDSAEMSLHSACISPTPATIRGIVAALPAAERRLVAAFLAQRRAAASVAAPETTGMA